MEPPLTVLAVGHVLIPAIDLRVARQKIRAAIKLGALEERPLQILADLISTRHHKPSLASVVSVHELTHLEVRAGRERRHSQTRSIVPLLPDTSASLVPPAAGAVRERSHATMRAVLEVSRHPRRKVARQPERHLVPAHRFHYVRMASHPLEQSRENHGPPHVSKM